MKPFYLSLVLGFLFLNTLSAQSVNPTYTVRENSAIEHLMSLKKELLKYEKAYRIQIFNGSKDEADNLLKTIKTQSQLPFYIFFETPNYKVRSCGFRSRIEAEKYLIEIKKYLPGAFIVLS